MARFEKYRLTYKVTDTETLSFFFLAPPNQYDFVGTVTTGVEKVQNDAIYKEMPCCTTEELLQSNVATKRKVRIRDGGKAKYVKVIVSEDAVDNFTTQAINTAYKGGQIEAVIEPLKAYKY